MVNVRGTRNALETAIAGQDPQSLAQVFALPTDGASSINGEPRKHNPQSLVIDSKDYGKILTALMDTVAAGDVVSDVIPNRLMDPAAAVVRYRSCFPKLSLLRPI